MKFNSKVVKFTAAAALTIGGLSAINANKPVNARPQKAQAATTSIKINYVPGYGVNVYDNFEHGHFTGQRVKHGTTWNVLNVATNAKGQTWYEIGPNKWVKGHYTVSANKPVRVAKATQTAAPAATRPAQASKASAVVSLAQKQIGKRYVWGATGPKAFDCSGLTSYVFAHAAGKNITRTTYSQVKQGRPVSLRHLQPGDLLFWGSKTAPYHVGIYIGNGQYIHAATPRQGVRKQTLSSYFYPAAARRVL